MHAEKTTSKFVCLASKGAFYVYHFVITFKGNLFPQNVFQLKIKFTLEPLLICCSEIPTVHQATGQGLFEEKNITAEAFFKKKTFRMHAERTT